MNRRVLDIESSSQLLPRPRPLKAVPAVRTCPRCRGAMTLSRHHPFLTSIARSSGVARGEFAWICATPWCDCCEIVESA